MLEVVIISDHLESLILGSKTQFLHTQGLNVQESRENVSWEIKWNKNCEVCKGGLCVLRCSLNAHSGVASCGKLKTELKINA